MVTDGAQTTSLADGLAALADAADRTEPLTLVVPVVEAVPPWLVGLAAAAHDQGARVLVSAEPPAGATGEAADGWEIGVCTAALAAGVDDVVGIDPRRVTRVRAVIEATRRATMAPPAEQPA